MKTKTYTITYSEDEDGETCISRTCDGFLAIELLGMLTLAQAEIIQQIRGEFKPDIIKRKFIEIEQEDETI